MSNHQRTILDLSRYIKVSREFAVLGEYDKAFGKYKTALHIIENRLKEVTDPYIKEKWNVLNQKNP
jgi:hypothetical protein